MYRLRLSFAIISVSLPALAANANQEMVLTGGVPALCLLGPVTSSLGSNATFDAAGGRVDAAIDPSIARIQPASIRLRINSAMCNFSALIGLTSKNGGMRSKLSQAAVPYTIVANWSGAGAVLDTSKGKTAWKYTNGPINGVLTLDFKTQESAASVAGSYHDTLIIKIGSAL